MNSLGDSLNGSLKRSLRTRADFVTADSRATLSKLSDGHTCTRRVPNRSPSEASLNCYYLEGWVTEKKIWSVQSVMVTKL